MNIKLYHADSENYSLKRVTEDQVRTICSDMINDQEMDTIGDEPIVKPTDDINLIIEAINNCSTSILLTIEER
jgi:hypothetical protein